MPEARRLDELKILESSGVDRPANLSDGWLVMKSGASVSLNNAAVGGTSYPSGFTLAPGYTTVPVRYDSSGGVVFTTATFGTGGIVPPDPPPVAKAAQGPHAYKASADDPKVCAVCGKSQGAGMHPRFGKALEAVLDGLQKEMSQLSPAAKTAADAFLSALTKEAPMPPDLDKLPDDVKAHIADLQAKADAAGTPPVVDPPAAPAPPAPAVEPPAAPAPDMVAMQKALADANAAREEETKKAADLAERVEKMEAKERTAEFLAKARDIPNIGGANELGSLLMDIAGKVPEDTYKSLERVLKAANAQLEKGALFGVQGNGGAEPDEESVDARVTKLAKAKLDAGTSKTIEQAKLDVLHENPDLASEYRAR